MFNEPLSREWRLEHVKLGDQLMVGYHKWAAEIDDDNDDPEQNSTAAALMSCLLLAAQAHYLAANVRARLS